MAYVETTYTFGAFPIIERISIMRILRISTRAVVLAASTFAMQAAVAQPPLQVELITPISEFTDKVAIQVRNMFYGRGTDVMNLSDASHIAVAKVTIQPKAVFPWHTHPGPVLITVVEGDFVYVLADDCVNRWYGPGTAVIDEGFGNVHTAYNPSQTEKTVVIATFLGVPAGGPLTILADGPDPGICPLPTP
ncbi:MAG TPA: cupin domain-containing protein [Gammaproteobacteria bacterium]|nr:cupin domain-containing protein [Gammaproteobacteria bacterium]